MVDFDQRRPITTTRDIPKLVGVEPLMVKLKVMSWFMVQRFVSERMSSFRM